MKCLSDTGVVDPLLPSLPQTLTPDREQTTMDLKSGTSKRSGTTNPVATSDHEQRSRMRNLSVPTKHHTIDRHPDSRKRVPKHHAFGCSMDNGNRNSMIKPRLQRIARSPAEGTSSLEKRMRLRASSAIQQAVSLSGNGDKISTAWRGGGGGYGWDKPSCWDHPPTPPPVAKLMRRPLPAPPDDPRESSSYLPQASGNQGVLQRLQARLSGAKQTSTHTGQRTHTHIRTLRRCLP